MFKHRLATSEDISDIQVLMDLSIKKLLGKILNENQLEASYESMGLDNQLIKDRTYFLIFKDNLLVCLLYTSPSPRDLVISRMPSSA